MHTKIKFCMQNVFFLENVSLRTKINLRLKKNKKNLGQTFKFTFCVAIKKMPVIQFPYMEIVR